MLSQKYHTVSSLFCKVYHLIMEGLTREYHAIPDGHQIAGLKIDPLSKLKKRVVPPK